MNFEKIGKDATIAILLDLPDKDIGHMCEINRNLRETCQSDDFWKLRMLKTYHIPKEVAKELEIEKGEESWKQFYVNLGPQIQKVKETLNIDIHTNPDSGHNKAITWASTNGYVELVKYLISLQRSGIPTYANIDPAANNNYAIASASKKGHLEVVKYLVSLKLSGKFPKIDPTAYSNLGIIWAYNYGHKKVGNYLYSLRKEFPSLGDITENPFYWKSTEN